MRLVVALLCLATLAHADFNFPNFLPPAIAAEQFNCGGAYPLQFLTFNKSVSSTPMFVDPFKIRSYGAIVISTNESQQAFAMWYTQKQYVVEGFNATITWQITEKAIDGGDGIAFVVQSQGLGGPDNIKPLGAAGKGMGYSGIPYSIAIEFDMYQDPDEADPNANHISAHSRGSTPNNADERPLSVEGSLLDSDPPIQESPLGDPALQMDSGMVSANISYIVNHDNPALTRIEIHMNGRQQPALTVREDIGKLLQLTDGYAYIGLTSATGDSYQLHEIYNWVFVGDPDILALIPSAGPAQGLTYVQVIGANYKDTGTIQCFFDNDASSAGSTLYNVNGTFVSVTRVDCVSPPHKPAITQVTLSFINGQPLRKTLPYWYYPPPNVTSSIPLGGPTYGQTNVTVKGEGFLPQLLNISTCQVGENSVAVISMTNDTIVCAPTPAVNDVLVGMRKLDISLNGQQYTGQARDFYYYHPFVIQRFKPRGGFVAGGGHVLMQGNFTMTPELYCKYGDTIYPALLTHPMYEKNGVTLMTCVSPGHSSGFYPLEVSGNNQQWTNFGYLYIYDANLWIWLVAGIVGVCALICVCLCAQCWAVMWKFKDYRLMATKEYREMTGKTAMQSMMEILTAKDAEDRRKTIQVLNMLKMKRKANHPASAINQKSRWGAAAAKALDQSRAQKMTGWDALLLGDHKPKQTAADDETTALKSENNSAGGTGGAERRGQPAPGAAWGAIMRMSKEGGGAGAAAGGGGSGGASGGKSGWSKLASAPKGDKKDYQPLM